MFRVCMLMRSSRPVSGNARRSLMHNQPLTDTAGRAALAGPVRIWRYSRTRRLVVIACAVLMVPLAFIPLLIAAVMLQVLKDSAEWITITVLALLGGITLIEV